MTPPPPADPGATLPPPAKSGADPSSDAAYLASAAACAVLVAIPFLVVTLPPITDLPQQTAQVRLLLETLGEDDGPYRVQWLSPNKLGYLPLLLGWLAAPPLGAGRLGVLLIGLSWVAALHLLARAFRRPAAAAALASVFFFNHLTYWGLLNFVAGLPVFALWLVIVERLERGRAGRHAGLKLLATATLLYLAHVLWLAAGLAWLVVSTVVRRLPLGVLGRRLAWTAPILGVALVWYPQLERSGFVSNTVWGRSPFGRLHPLWHLNSAFGGLEGAVEPALALAVAGWLLLGLVQDLRLARGGGVHRGLLLAAAMLIAAALCLPAVIQSTIFFASRWLPMGVVLLVLALPQPRLGKRALRAAVPLVVLASLSAATAAAWITFETRELDGLDQSLAAAPAGERLLGLDFVRTSKIIKGYPFYHCYAYAQVLHGSDLARPFTNLGSSLVVFRDLPRTFPWTEGLDWRARKIRKSDMDHFGAVLIFGPPSAHAPFLADPRLTPVTEDRPWRLYLVDPGEIPPRPPRLQRGEEKPAGELSRRRLQTTDGTADHVESTRQEAPRQDPRGS